MQRPDLPHRWSKSSGSFAGYRGQGKSLGLLLLLTLLLTPGCTGPPPEDSRPAPTEPAQAYNLVVICLDTVRYDTFGLPETAQSRDVLAPWLKEAQILTNTQAPSPWTVPSVASLLTGLYPYQHGAGHFQGEVADLSTEVPSGLTESLETLPELLSTHGYETAAFVAHPWFEAGYGLDRGFAHLHLRKGRKLLSEVALDWLDKRRARQTEDAAKPAEPFLIYLHFMEAHGARRQRGPMLEETIARLPPALRQLAVDTAPGDSCRDPDARPCKQYLAYVVTVLDLRETVAEWLQAMADRGLSERTITVVYSDHGDEFLDHYQAQKSLGLVPKGRYGKGHGHTLYQELLHVPTLIWHPDFPGRKIYQPVSLIDLMPTLLGWLDIPSPRPRWPGTTIEDLSGDTGRESSRHLFSSSIAYGPEQTAVRSGPWKRIRYGQDRRELFHLERDPLEQQPVEESEVAANLDHRLDQYLASRPTAGEAAPEISSEELERLQSLGYLEGVKPNN